MHLFAGIDASLERIVCRVAGVMCVLIRAVLPRQLWIRAFVHR